MGHTCHWPGCPAQVPPRLWGCRQHWYQLPRSLRTRLLDAYRPGQQIDKNPSVAYLQAATDVQQWIASGAEA